MFRAKTQIQFFQLKTGIDKIVGMLESKNGRDSLDKKFP